MRQKKKAAPPSPDSVRSSSRFIFPRAGGRYQAAAVAETAAYRPPSSRASISSVSCRLKMSPARQTGTFDTARLLSHFLSEVVLLHHPLKFFCNVNTRNIADACDKLHSHILYSHSGRATRVSKQFFRSLRCHKHSNSQKMLSGCPFFFTFIVLFFASRPLRRMCHSSPGASRLCRLHLLESSPPIRSEVATEAR